MRRILVALLVVLVLAPLARASKEGGVVLYDRVEVTFFNDGRQIWKEERAVKVLNMKGVKEQGEVVLPFSTKHQKLKVLYAYTVLPNGQKLKPAKEAYNIVSPPFESQAPIYSDLKYQTISMPGVAPGATIHYGFVLKTVKPYMKGQFWAANYFQERYPVEESSMVARIPLGRKVKIKAYHMEGVKPRVTREKGYMVYRWRVTHVPALEEEPSMPPTDELAKKVVITSLSSWDQVARWYHSLAREALKPDDRVKRAVKAIVKGARDRDEAIRRIYDFVAQNIRYVGMEFGINGYKPHKAGDVLENRYGDCKDHATLLIAMLRVMGVKAYPVLIPTQDVANLDPEVPRPTAFNHEIAAMEVKGRLLFMDTTAEVTPLGDLPAGDQDRRVLVVKGDRALLARTPLFPPQRNVEGYRGTFTLEPGGDLVGTMEFYYRGIYASMERYLFLTSTPQSIRRHIEQMATSISPGFDVVSYNLSPYRDLDHQVITVTLEGKDRLYATPTAHLLILHPPVPSYSRLASLVAPRKRHYTYVVGYRMSKESQATIRIPGGYDVYLLPEDYSFKNRVGSLKISWQREGREIRFHSLLVLDRAFIPVDLYGQLRDLFNLTVKALKNQVLILKRTEGS